MKIKNIILTGVAALALASCNDYLDVEAPSKYTMDFVYTQKSEVERALNGVYAQSLVGDLYGNAYQKNFTATSTWPSVRRAHTPTLRTSVSTATMKVAKF